MKVVGQVGLVPRVLLDLLQGDSLHRVGLEHAIYQVLNSVGYIVRDEVAAIFDLAE